MADPETQENDNSLSRKRVLFLLALTMGLLAICVVGLIVTPLLQANEKSWYPSVQPKQRPFLLTAVDADTLVGTCLTPQSTGCVHEFDPLNDSSTTPGFFVLPASLPMALPEVRRTLSEEPNTQQGDRHNDNEDCGYCTPLPHQGMNVLSKPTTLSTFPLVLLGLHSHDQHLSSVYRKKASDASLPPEIAIVKECISAVDSNVALRIRTRDTEDMKLIAVNCEESVKNFHRWAGTTTGYRTLSRYQNSSSKGHGHGESWILGPNDESRMSFSPTTEHRSETPSRIGRRQLWYPSFDCHLLNDPKGQDTRVRNPSTAVENPSAPFSAPTVTPSAKAPRQHSLTGFPLINNKLVIEQCMEQVCEESAKLCPKDKGNATDVTEAKKEQNEQGEKNGSSSLTRNTVRLCCPSRNETAIRRHCEEYSRKNSGVLWILFFLAGSVFLFAFGAIAYREIRDRRNRRKGARASATQRLNSVDDSHAGMGTTDGFHEHGYGSILRNHERSKSRVQRLAAGPDSSRLEDGIDGTADITDYTAQSRRPWYRRIIPQQASKTGEEAITENMGLRRVSFRKRPLPGASHDQPRPTLPPAGRSSSIDMSHPAQVVQSPRNPLTEREPHNLSDLQGQRRLNRDGRVIDACPALLMPREGKAFDDLDERHVRAIFDGLNRN
jgi:hypothetical protein